MNYYYSQVSSDQIYATCDTSERITHWVERLEQQAEELLKLEPEAMDELSAKERLVLGARYLTLLQHFLRLAQHAEASTPDNSTQQAVEKISEHLRGEWPPA